MFVRYENMVKLLEFLGYRLEELREVPGAFCQGHYQGIRRPCLQYGLLNPLQCRRSSKRLLSRRHYRTNFRRPRGVEDLLMHKVL